MQIGITFDEYVDVKLRPSARADRAFHEGAAMERDEMFPMTTVTASHHLRARGYDCRPVTPQGRGTRSSRPRTRCPRPGSTVAGGPRRTRAP